MRYRSHCCSCTLLLSRSPDPCHVPFPKFFQWSRQHFIGSILAELEVCNFSHFSSYQHLTPQNLRGHVTVTTPTFRKYLSGVMWGLFPGSVFAYPNRFRHRDGFTDCSCLSWAWLTVVSAAAAAAAAGKAAGQSTCRPIRHSAT